MKISMVHFLVVYFWLYWKVFEFFLCLIRILPNWMDCGTNLLSQLYYVSGCWIVYFILFEVLGVLLEWEETMKIMGSWFTTLTNIYWGPIKTIFTAWAENKKTQSSPPQTWLLKVWFALFISKSLTNKYKNKAGMGT